MSYSYGREITENIISKHGKVIYFLGTAGIGPVNEPILIETEEELLNTFGSDGTIPKAFYQLLEIPHSAQLVFCKVLGLHSLLHYNVNIVGDDIVENGLIFTSKGASELYNDIQFEITPNEIIISYPDEFGGYQMSYSFETYPILGLLIRRINSDADNGFGHVYVSTHLHPNTETFGALLGVNPPVSQMYGGDNGLEHSKAELYYALQDTYELLESYYIDFAVPLEAYIDDVHPRMFYGSEDYYNEGFYAADRNYLNLFDNEGPATFHRQLIDFCKKQMRFGIVTHGVIGMNPFKDIEALINPEINYLMRFISNSVIGKRLGFQNVIESTPNGDDGRFLSIICGDFKFKNGIIENGYIVYSALLASTEENVSTTNIPIPGELEFVHQFTNEELQFLSNNSVTSFRVSPLKGLVVSNGVTGANPKSEYHYVCNIRMVQLILSRIFVGLRDRVGENINQLIENKTLEEDLYQIFLEAKKVGIIKEEQHSVDYNLQKGEAIIDLKLKTLYMVESVDAKFGG